MQGFSLYTSQNKPTTAERSAIVGFLFQHLDQYGDSKSEIGDCLKFALKEGSKSLGGFALVYRGEDGEIAGLTLVNETGMKGYIPENILVYIAVHEKSRGKGIGKKIMRKAFEYASGEIALHVEPDNPARYLYENLGFTSKYLEMRYPNKS